MSAKTKQRLGNYARALGRLDEALAVSPDAPLAVDGTVQRFEFTFELAWKSAKAALEDEGLVTRTPREALREAMRVGWIADERAWLEMLHDRNLSSHIYSEEVAGEIYARIRTNAPALHALHTTLLNG